MKIIYKEIKYDKLFKDIIPGQAFKSSICSDVVFMKLVSPVDLVENNIKVLCDANAIELTDGIFRSFSDNCTVKLYENAELHLNE